MNDEKAKKIRDALAGWKTGQYQSVSACAEYFQVPRTTLRDMIRDNREEWTGLGGSQSKVFTPEEETIIKNFIIERVELVVGLTLNQVQDVMQEILLEKRHNLTYRSTMSIHKGRAIVDPRTVHSWFELTKERAC